MSVRLLVLMALWAGFAARPAGGQAPQPTRQARVSVRDARTPQDIRDADYPPYKRESGPFEVQIAEAEWLDGPRARTVRVMAFRPRENQLDARPRPLILLSTGTHATRADYSFLADHWASHGLITLVVEHEPAPGPAGTSKGRRPSDDDEPALRRDLPLDLRFALDRALQDPALARRIDPGRVGVAGQGMGAYAALAVCGVAIDFPAAHRRGGRRAEAARLDQSFLDPRFRAALLLSPPSEDQHGLDRAAWRSMATPAMHVVGTRDEDDAIRSWRDRLIGYEQTLQRDQYLVTIRNADFDALNDLKLDPRAERKRDPRVRAWLKMATTAFWDAHLLADPAAQRWLLADTLEGASARAIRLDHKNIVPLNP